MKLVLSRFIFFLYLVWGSTLLAQTYPNVIIERSSPDEDNQIFKPGNTYTYQYVIERHGQQYWLDKNSGNSWHFTQNKEDSGTIQQIKLSVLQAPKSKRTNKKQTEIAYYSAPLFSFMETTGLAENAQNLWAHPLRSGFFRSLETCPFPYVKYPLKPGSTWEDKMLIGSYWASPEWGTWEGKLLLEYQYQVIGKKEITSPLGTIMVWEITSQAQSKIGTTQLDFLFSETYGFVALAYTLSEGTKIRFQLLDREQGKYYKNMEELVRDQLK